MHDMEMKNRWKMQTRLHCFQPCREKLEGCNRASVECGGTSDGGGDNGANAAAGKIHQAPGLGCGCSRERVLSVDNKMKSTEESGRKVWKREGWV